MKKISIVTDVFYNNDRLFDSNDPISNRDGCLTHFIEFKQRVSNLGFAVHTSDVLSPSEADFTFFIEMPSNKPHNSSKNYLFLYESEVIRADNWNLYRHTEFDKIFTWNDDFVDGKKYFKLNFIVQKPNDLNWQSTKRNFLTQISGNKIVYHPNELYSERVKAARWWGRNHPEEFEFYGIGWEKATWGKACWSFNKAEWLRRFARPFCCYGGRIDKKIEILKNYKFSLCYENAFGYPGYITEKIFDCFFAGTVPIYWGPPNIGEHIPCCCFIDRTHFKSYSSLRKYLRTMSDKVYQNYLNNIAEFISSPAILPFYSSSFSEVVIPQLG